MQIETPRFTPAPPVREGLYDPSFERDACGVGFLAGFGQDILNARRPPFLHGQHERLAGRVELIQLNVAQTGQGILS